jgi:hypothetical protein
MGDGFVGYLTTIDLSNGRSINLWRALGTRDEMWFERLTTAGWVEDPRLLSQLTSPGTVRLTEDQARAVAEEIRSAPLPEPDSPVEPQDDEPSLVEADVPHAMTVDERWFRDWVGFGMLDVAVYLTRHAEFDAYYESLDRSRTTDSE